MQFTQEMPLQKKDDRIEYLIFIIFSNFLTSKSYDVGWMFDIDPILHQGSYIKVHILQ